MDPVPVSPLVEVPEPPGATPSGLATWLGAGGTALLLLLVLGLLARRILAPKLPSIAAEPDVPALVETAPEPEPRDRRAALAPWTDALSRTAQAFRGLFGRAIDEALLTELEEALLRADVGLATSERLLGAVRSAWRGGETGPDALRAVLRREMCGILAAHSGKLTPTGTAPWVVLVVGVNGSGKTTTIGKLAARWVGEGKRVLVAAGDTYRAAAAEQLGVWAQRAGADLVRHDEGADPGAVAFDALQAAIARGHDIVLIDTAGRLQTRKPLMEQLSKIRRVIAKVVPDGPHETLLVLDGTMGQNAISQARLFHEATPLTAVAITKLDGTAKGGMVLALAAELQLPIKLVGVGEKVADLRDFEPEVFVNSIA